MVLAEDVSAEERLFNANLFIVTGVVYLAFGGMLVYQSASSLGGVGSTAWQVDVRRFWLAVPLLAAAILVGQTLVNDPGRAPWIFPAANLAVVAVPSMVVAAFAAHRYARSNPLSWPVSWREWSSGFGYGAIGATTAAGIINTLYVIFAGALAIHLFGEGDAFNLEENLPTLPRGLGVAFDLSVLSVVAPINEEFWKGLLVALFFFRRGGLARCFLWGVLAGAGFNLIETFTNSLVVVNPDALRDQQISGQWWVFAVARAGTSVLHGAAAGMSALGIAAVLRRAPRFLWGYPAGVLLHASWNFMAYVVSGDAFLTQAGPDSTLLDVAGIAGMIAIFLAGCAIIWTLSARLRDARPAPVYDLLGMLPAVAGPAPSTKVVAPATPSPAPE
ncbi:MAG: hypothetical protein Kow0010_20120 [Dehalococcoidia bacterium]